MKLQVEWPYQSHWIRRSFDTNSVIDSAQMKSVMEEVISLSHIYDVIIDNGVITFVEKA
jgi:hypothetical protein